MYCPTCWNEKLHEWVDKNGNKVNHNTTSSTSTASSGSYKKRFEKLIKYHIDHASSELESITKKDIKDYGFHLGEHYNTGLSEFDREIVASADKDTGILTFSIFVDGSEVCRRDCKNYEEFVKELNDSYMYLTYKGTPDYDDLLVEWVDKDGNKVGTNTSSSGPSNSSTASSPTNLYVVFNYYRPNDLDGFCMLLAETDKTATVQALIDMAEQSVENFGKYRNTLVCYKINPNDYDLDANDFIDAAEDKYYYGPDLHADHRYVVYALSAMASDEKPLYALDKPIVEIEFYEEFLNKNSRLVGFTIDDIIDSNYDSDLISQVYNDASFQKFMKDKLKRTITNAL